MGPSHDRFRGLVRSLPQLAVAFCVVHMVGAALAADADAAEAASRATWRSALYPVDWDPNASDASGRFLPDFGYAGYHAGLEPIPDSPPGPVVDATQAPYGADPTGTTDSTAAIQQALDAVGASGGGVVYLPAGTYLISLPAGQGWALRIRYSGTVLRGAGAGQTFLECTSTVIRNANIVLVRPDAGSVYTAAGATHLLTADAANRATTVTLADVAGLQVGDRVVLKSDWTQAFIDEHGMTGIWNPTSSYRSGLYLRRVVAIDGTSVTLDTPIRYPLKTRDNACLYVCEPFLGEVGIEDLAIGNRQHPDSGWESRTNGWGDEDYSVAGTGAYEVHGSHLLRFYHVWDGWVRRVSTYRPVGNSGNVHALSNIFIISSSRFVTFADCAVARTQYEGGGGNGYGLSFSDANDCLMTGCEVVHTRHNYDFKLAGSNGNVVHRSAGRTPRLASDFHMYLSMGNLFDSMTMDGDFLECRYRPYGAGTNLHGHAGTQNVFWNTYGTAARSDKVVESRQFGYGYVIGTSGPTSSVVLTPLDRVDTSPQDWSEGIGTGDQLSPKSLYEDQLSRRDGLRPQVTDGTPVATHNAATLSVTVAGQSGQAILYWGSADGGMVPDAWEHQIALGAVAPGPVDQELLGLLPTTTYRYRWLVWNEDGEDWADQSGSFTTGLGPVIESADVALATTAMGTFSADLFGVDAAVTLYWGTADGGTDAGAWEHAIGPSAETVGRVNVTVDDLPPATVVHYRWHASTDGAESWSSASGTVDTTPVLTVSDVTVGEDEGTAVFTVELAPVSSVATTFDVATEDGAAVAREDFVGVAAGVSIPAGEASVPVVVTLLDDYTVEPYRESFGLALSGAANARIGTPSATGTILDDDTPSVPVPGGLVLHLDASALVGVLADGEATTTWPDTSGVGNDAVTDAGSPIWYEQGIGGRPAFWFDGVDATFVAPSIRPESGAVSVYIISEKDAADGGNYQRLTACDSGEANDWTMPNWAINGYPSGAAGGAPAAYPARLDSRQYPDGRGIGPIRLARQATTAGGWFRGDIAEMLVYDRYLTAEEHALVSSWLEAKYAVAGFSVAPSLVVQGLGQTIASGDTSPDAADGTDFGETVGNHVFEVRNLGTDALTISSINVDSTHFTLAPPDPLTVAPGAVATFSVAFAPTVQGSYAATVTIISNDADSPYTFAVRGEKTTSVLDVEFGTGDGSYAEGASVGIVADTRPGRTFANWVVSPPEFADNLSKALSDRTDFSMPDRDVTVTATYTLDAPQWSVTLNVTNGQPESLQFGMHEAASDGFDEGLDLGVPTPGVGEACLASEDLVLTLASDYRAVGETAEFLLVANAPVGEPLTVAWAVSGLPAQTCLSLYEVEWDGSAWIPVGSTAIDMATTTACVVPAGETRRLAIRFGGELVYDLALEAGWNLVSLPIAPTDPSVSAVFGEAAARDSARSAGERGAIRSGSVWGWAGNGYVSAAQVEACTGYWVYVVTPGVELVQGTAVTQAALSLEPGWNLCGVNAPSRLPVDGTTVGRAWSWHPAVMRYSIGSLLVPGTGYWIRATEAATIPLDKP